MKKLQPTKVLRVNCTKCGELLAKFYPLHTFNIKLEPQGILCKNCINRSLKSGVAQ